MDRIPIPRVAPFASRSVGWWPALRDGVRVVHLVCGGCGRHAGTLDDHTIDEAGNVSPSILCPAAGCGWHVYGRLVGWDPGELAERATRPTTPGDVHRRG